MNEPNQGTSVLRQRMIEDMRMRKLSPKTQATYIRAVRRLAAYLGRSPDTATVEELQAYQLYLVDQGTSALAQTGLQKVNHIIIVMQENHSFDNYFGALAYAPGTPYHTPNGNSGCRPDDNACVDGLSCLADTSGGLHCFNTNLDDDGSQVFAFHNPSRCVVPDLNHSWYPTHQEDNYENPDNTFGQSLNDGFLRVNDLTRILRSRCTAARSSKSCVDARRNCSGAVRRSLEPAGERTAGWRCGVLQQSH